MFGKSAMWLGLLIVALVLGIAVLPAGVWKTYDWGLHAAWIERFYQQMASGQFWPQWLADADGGRGAPVFVFYPPMAYWIAAAFRALVGDSVLALELSEGLAILLLYLSSYRLFRPGNSARHAACLAACCCLSPAVLFITFRVHMLAAVVALAAFPCLLHALRQHADNRLARVLELALAFAFIGWSHLLSVLMAGMLAVGFVSALIVANPAASRSLVSVAVAGLGLGLLMSLAPLWPALFELRWISAGNASIGTLDWRSNFLFDLPASVGSFRDDYLFLTLAAVSLLVGSLLVWLASARARQPQQTDAAAIAQLALVCVALTTPLAWPLYALSWPLQALQFPWRWLAMASVCALFAIAALLPTRDAPRRWLAAAMVVSSVGFLVMTQTVSGLLPSRVRTTLAQQQWTVHEMPRAAPEYRPRQLQASHSEAELATAAPPPTSLMAGVALVAMPDSLQPTQWRVAAQVPATIQFAIACFPGWNAYLDQQAVPLDCDDRGLLQLSIGAGTFDLRLAFEPTPARMTTRIISAAAAGLWLLLGVLNLRRTQRRNRQHSLQPESI